jgi:hypothetical protein
MTQDLLLVLYRDGNYQKVKKIVVDYKTINKRSLYKGGGVGWGGGGG